MLNTQLLIKQTSTDKLNAWPPGPPAVRRAGNEGRVHLHSPTLLTGTTDSEVTNTNPNAHMGSFRKQKYKHTTQNKLPQM